MPYIGTGVGEPDSRLNDIRGQVDALFAHFKAFMIDLAQTRVQVKVPTGDTGLINFVIHANDFFKTTITTLDTDIFPQLLFHLINRVCHEEAPHRDDVRPDWFDLLLVSDR